MALERVHLLKQEWSALGGDTFDEREYPAPLDPAEDVPEVRGLYIETESSARDGKVLVSRALDHLTLADGAVPLTRKLVDALLEGGAIDSVATQIRFIYSSGQPTKEDLTISATGKLLRRTMWTYSQGQVSVETVTVYGQDGVTVVAQVTRTFSYSQGQVDGVATIRDV